MKYLSITLNRGLLRITADANMDSNLKVHCRWRIEIVTCPIYTKEDVQRLIVDLKEAPEVAEMLGRTAEHELNR